MTNTFHERRAKQVTDAKQIIADALANEGPMTPAELDALRRSHFLDLVPWQNARHQLIQAGKIDVAPMNFVRVRRRPIAQPVFAPEALRRKRHAVINARYRMSALDLLGWTGSTTRSAAELVDALDAVFAILAAKQSGTTDIHELATAAQEATGIERDNLADVLQRLAKVGVIEGRPTWD